MPTDRPRSPLTPEQRAHLEQRLLEERKRLLRELGRNAEMLNASSTAADGDLTNYPFHMADQGTDTMEQEKGMLLASQESRTLSHIDLALRRLYRSPETFGLCNNCGQPIPFERLDALPYANYCVNCRTRRENGEPAPAE